MCLLEEVLTYGDISSLVYLTIGPFAYYLYDIKHIDTSFTPVSFMIIVMTIETQPCEEN